MSEVKAREHETTHIGDQIKDWRNTIVDKALGLVPRRTAEHLINAQKEGILAVRSLLDRGVETLDNDLKRVLRSDAEVVMVEHKSVKVGFVQPGVSEKPRLTAK